MEELIISESTRKMLNVFRGFANFQNMAENQFMDIENKSCDSILNTLSQSYNDILNNIVANIRETLTETCGKQV